jgi:hypothetical protein
MCTNVVEGSCRKIGVGDMSYDGFDSGFGDSDDPAVFYGVPSDHPAFRQPDDDEDGIGEVGEPDGYGGKNDEVGGAILNFPVGRYDGVTRQNDSEVVGVARVDESRQRAADRQFLADRLDASRRGVAERAIGQRNAIAHSRGVGEGEGSDGSTLHSQLAASLEQAGIRFRSTRNGDGSGDNPAIDPEEVVQAFLNGPEVNQQRGGWQKSLPPTQPLTRAKRGIIEAPKFQEAHMIGTMGGLKSNVSGTWVLTLLIDSDSYEEATKLGKAHGLALEIGIKRKNRND